MLFKCWKKCQQWTLHLPKLVSSNERVIDFPRKETKSTCIKGRKVKSAPHWAAYYGRCPLPASPSLKVPLKWGERALKAGKVSVWWRGMSMWHSVVPHAHAFAPCRCWWGRAASTQAQRSTLRLQALMWHYSLYWYTQFLGISEWKGWILVPI